ncbi:MAG: hypothetical protein P8Q31_02590 [Luminiphilus sp.]|jgi:hypothetical protein|nr:hypothetical protein [Luminiphilus sp.]MDG1460384.1 hypothetical protein [Luminiphilus sp.]
MRHTALGVVAVIPGAMAVTGEVYNVHLISCLIIIAQQVSKGRCLIQSFKGKES